MKCRLWTGRRAIPAAAVGMALLIFLGCQSPKALERPQPPETGGDLFLTAERDLGQGRYENAIGGYERYRAKNPLGSQAALALYRIAQIHYLQDRYENALSLLRRFAGEYPLHPELPAVQYDIARAYYRLGEYPSAMREALEWVREHPDNPIRSEVYLLLGKSARAIQDGPQALFWWIKAANEQDTSSERAAELATQILGLIDASALESLPRMAGYASGTRFAPHVYHRMASLYRKEKRPLEAKEAAMALVRSTEEQGWVEMGRRLLQEIAEETRTPKAAIGCLLPLSGPFSIYGQEILNGIRLGISSPVGSEEKRGVELIIKDSQGDPERASLLVEELVTRDKVMAVIGPLAAKSALAAARKAQQLSVPIITLTQREGITGEGDMVFRNFLTPSMEIKALLRRATTEMGIKRFALLYPDSPYGRFLMNLFWEEAEKMGGIITAMEEYRHDELDFSLPIRKMVGLHRYPRPPSAWQTPARKGRMEQETPGKALSSPREGKEPIVDFDAVFIPDNPQQVALIAPQFPFHDIFHIRLLGTSLWQSSELIETAADYLQGAVFPSRFFAGKESEEMKDFLERYRMEFTSEPGVLAALGYDTIRYVSALIEQRGITARKDLHKALLSARPYAGLTGQIAFDAQREVTAEPMLLTVHGRSFALLP